MRHMFGQKNNLNQLFGFDLYSHVALLLGAVAEVLSQLCLMHIMYIEN